MVSGNFKIIVDSFPVLHYFLTAMSYELQVDLGDRSYPIVIGTGLLSGLGERCRTLCPGGACALVTDRHVDALYGDEAVASLNAAGFRPVRAVVPAGEESKSRDRLFELFDQFLENNLDRKSLVVALGGGVVGDLAGFAAAAYLRGVPFVQVPTTLLAMVDSSVGGKTGINMPQGKNLIGAFHQPRLVLADLLTLSTLAPREFRAGLAEVIKYGLIADADFFDHLEKHVEQLHAASTAFMEGVVSRCCEIKAAVVRQDEREGGLRAILNFGHTLGHALENAGGYRNLLHGEAVAVGMVFAAKVSVQAGRLSACEAERIEALIAAAGLPVRSPGYAWADLRRAIALDKKTSAGLPRWVLADAVGRVTFGCDVPEAVMEEVWHGFCQ